MTTPQIEACSQASAWDKVVSLLERWLGQVTLTNITMTLILFIIFGFLIALMVSVVRQKENGIEWWHFISIQKPSGDNWGDLDKLIKLWIAAMGSWAVVKAAYATPPDLTGLSLVLTAFFAFGGGVAYGSAKLRTDQAIATEANK